MAVPVTLFTATDRLRSFTRLIKAKSNCRIGLCFRYHTHGSRPLEMSRVNRRLNKARNPDYFVSGIPYRRWATVYSLTVILRDDKGRRKRERRESRQGEIKKKYARLTYAFNDRLETSGPRSVCLSGASLFWQ